MTIRKNPFAFVDARLLSGDEINADKGSIVWSNHRDDRLTNDFNAICQIDQLNVCTVPRHRSIIEKNPNLAKDLSRLLLRSIRRILISDESGRIRTKRERKAVQLSSVLFTTALMILTESIWVSLRFSALDACFRAMSLFEDPRREQQFWSSWARRNAGHQQGPICNEYRNVFLSAESRENNGTDRKSSRWSHWNDVCPFSVCACSVGAAVLDDVFAWANVYPLRIENPKRAKIHRWYSLRAMAFVLHQCHPMHEYDSTEALALVRPCVVSSCSMKIVESNVQLADQQSWRYTHDVGVHYCSLLTNERFPLIARNNLESWTWSLWSVFLVPSLTKHERMYTFPSMINCTGMRGTDAGAVSTGVLFGMEETWSNSLSSSPIS